MAKKVGVVQWNSCGLLRDIDDVNLFFDELHRVAICLQKTHLNDFHTQQLRCPQFFSRKDRVSSNPSGGVALAVQSGVARAQVPLQTPLEVRAVHILLNHCRIDGSRGRHSGT